MAREEEGWGFGLSSKDDSAGLKKREVVVGDNGKFGKEGYNL